ncbi:MAG: AhpC/TSA family protein [Candidatus Obscuribacterales bacterium]|nr:AhpC/TSA family protein [Candidatus Obscuribacterales bacterium]
MDKLSLTDSRRNTRKRVSIVPVRLFCLTLVSLSFLSSIIFTQAFAHQDQIGEKKMTLTEALQQHAQESRGKMPEEAREVMAKAISELTESGIEQSVTKAGEKIPDFVLPNAGGKDVSLQSLRQEGPVVLVFYRGGWCPYCNINLHYLQERLKEIEEQGARVVAISPETPDNSLSTKEKNALKFDVLSDANNTYARKLGLVFRLPDDVLNLYKKFGIDLSKSNGNTSSELPLSATFIVAQDGTIEFRFVDSDYKKRMDPKDIVSKLKTIKSANSANSAACCDHS